MPKVSIIVPVYNVEKYLKKCIESLIRQTLQDIEIICINDGSQDSSPSILDEFAKSDCRIKVLHKDNTGYGNSMNIGLEQATGDYIGIVESDDFADYDMFEDLYNAALLNNVEVVKSNYKSFTHEMGDYDLREILIGFNYGQVFSPKDNTNIFNIAPSIWTAIYNREFLHLNQIRFNETPGASYQDTSFAFKVWACADKVILLQKAYLNYRISNMDSSVKNPTKIFCICDEFKEIERFMINRSERMHYWRELETAIKFDRYRWNYNRLSASYQYTFLIRIHEEMKDADQKGYIKREYWDIKKWNELQMILNNYDLFYEKTAKDDYDERVISFTDKNLHIYMQGLFQYLEKFKGIIIYGAGVIGTMVAEKIIDKNNGIHIQCFAVSDIKNNPSDILGIPVYCIYDIPNFSEDYLILISTKERMHYEIIKLLKDLNFQNIIVVDAFLLNVLKKGSNN